MSALINTNPFADSCPSIDDSKLLDSAFRKVGRCRKTVRPTDEFLADPKLLKNDIASSKNEVKPVKKEPLQEPEPEPKPELIEEEEECTVDLEEPEPETIQSIEPPVEDSSQVPAKGTVVLDRYVILEELGDGELTRVFLAKDLSFDRMVAVKTLKNPQPDMVLAFAAEVEKLSLLEHENLPEFIDYQESGGYPYYIMEYVDAPTMGMLLDQICRPDRRANCQCHDSGYAMFDTICMPTKSCTAISAPTASCSEQEGEVSINYADRQPALSKVFTIKKRAMKATLPSC
ncbi:MAG: protein kinase [Cyanobacteriota/Melainabacteria group bacterium]